VIGMKPSDCTPTLPSAASAAGFSSRVGRSRRQLLENLGRAALALPFLELTRGRAHADGGPVRAKNFLMITMPNGIAPEQFWPTGGERDFKLSPVLQSLERHRDKLLILGPQFPNASSRTPVPGSGLVIMKSPGIHRAWTATTGDHIQARRFAQTGDGLNVKTNHPSVDQLIAHHLKTAPLGPSAARPTFDSLEFGVHPVGGDVPCIVNFTMTGAPMPRMVNDQAAWARVFGGLVPSTDRDRRTEMRAAVSNFLHGRFAALAPTLGRADRQRLEHHMQALREVEARIGGAGPAARPGCPIAGGMPFKAALPDPLDPNADVPALYANMQDMVALAFSCGLTRVASISFSHEGGGALVPTWLGLKSEHHALSHKLADPAQRERFNQIVRWAADMVARMLDRLKELPHPEGGTLYDQTVLWWMFRHGHGNQHASHGIPGIIAGGAGGYYGKMGRFLSLPGSNYFGMLLSLVNAMGIDIPSFGLGDNQVTAALPGLRSG
jgi:Protein of unknown function (DUF1552)